MRCRLYSAEDLRQILREKSLLERIKRARRYDRDTGEVLHIIEVSCDDNSLSLGDRDLMFLVLQCMLAQL